MNNIIVTGGAGMIGHNLCRELLKNTNNYVICIDNNYSSNGDNIKDLNQHNRFRFLHHDITKPISISNVSTIYHLACAACVDKYQQDPVFTLNTCFNGTLNMLHLANENRAKLIFTSTSEVYGDPEHRLLCESYNGNVSTTSCRACYDEGKRVAETLIKDYCDKYDLKYCILRIFNTYGPGFAPDDNRVVNSFVRSLKNHQDLTILGNGEQTRSFCYIDDTIRALISAMNVDYSGPINVGSQDEITINKLAETILHLSPFSKSKIVYLPERPSDPVHRKPDLTLAKQYLNWQPEITLKQGLRRLLVETGLIEI